MDRLAQNVDQWTRIGLLIGTVNADGDTVVTLVMPEAEAQDVLDLDLKVAAEAQVRKDHDVAHAKLIVVGNAVNVLIYTLPPIVRETCIIGSLGTFMILMFKINQEVPVLDPLPYHLLLPMLVIHTDHRVPIMDEIQDHTRGQQTEEGTSQMVINFPSIFQP